MGFWKWLLDRLNEPSTRDEEERKDNDRYSPGGMDKQFRGGAKEIGRQFRRAFGERDEEDEQDE